MTLTPHFRKMRVTYETLSSNEIAWQLLTCKSRETCPVFKYGEALTTLGSHSRYETAVALGPLGKSTFARPRP